MAESQRTTDEIRRDIERTRSELDETVQAIGDRMSPGQIVDQLWHRVRGGDAASSFVEAVKEHPMPSLLMGLGLGWLVYERDRGTDAGRLSDAAESVGERVSGARAGLQATGERVSERLHDVGERTVERLEQVREGTAERLDQVREHVGERLHKVRDRAADLSHRTRDGLTRTYDEQPLALGAVAFGLGLASGLVAPATSLEDEAMGGRADRVKDEVRRTGSETLESAKRVAGEARRTARDVIEREGVLDDLKEKARHIADETRSAARQAAEREGLDAEGLKHRTRAAADRVRE